MELQQQEEEHEKQWDGGELLVCALVQLLLVNVAYRIDRQKSAPLLSTSSWAIFCGLGVRREPQWTFDCHPAHDLYVLILSE